MSDPMQGNEVRDFGVVNTAMGDAPQQTPTATPPASAVVRGVEVKGDASQLQAFRDLVGRASKAPIVLNLTTGHRVVVQEPKGSAQFKAIMLVPPELAVNGMLIATVQSALYVLEVDGKPVVLNTFAKVQELIDELGDEGLSCLRCLLEDHYPTSESFKKLMMERNARPL